MFGITLSDLLYRRRQFLIATVGASLVFAMTLLLAGLVGGFSSEIDQSVSGFHADVWMVKTGSSGRIASLAPMDDAAASRAARVRGSPEPCPS